MKFGGCAYWNTASFSGSNREDLGSLPPVEVSSLLYAPKCKGAAHLPPAYHYRMAVVENPAQIARVRSYCQALEAEVSRLKVRPRRFARYPFDLVGLGIVSKAFSISNALLVLLDSGFAEEAYGLSRSLVECALTLRFLTQDQDKQSKRTFSYVQFEVADKQYWMHYALQHATEKSVEEKILDHAKEFDLKADPTGIRKHWSGKEGFAWKVSIDDHPLDNVASTELAKKSHYAVEYHATSSFVHCYSPALNNFLPEEFAEFQVKPSSGSCEKPEQKTLFVLISYLHSCVVYALFGMNLERTPLMNDLFSDVLAALLPYRRLRMSE